MKTFSENEKRTYLGLAGDGPYMDACYFIPKLTAPTKALLMEARPTELDGTASNTDTLIHAFIYNYNRVKGEGAISRVFF